jgi:mono/diheme cytochrome c family protein
MRFVKAVYLLPVLALLGGCAAKPAAPTSAAAVSATFEEDLAISRGKAIAEAKCSTCHAIGPTGTSPQAQAPAWRDLIANRDADELAKAFSEGRLVHRSTTIAMPEFMFSPQEIGDIIAYMKALRS